MDILGQSALIVAVTSFSLAVNALSRNVRNKLVLNYALLCSVVGLWAFFFFLEKFFTTGTFYQLHLAVNLILAPVGIFFLRSLTRVETPFIRILYHVSLVYAVAVNGLGLSALSEKPVVRGFAFFGPSFLAVACFYLMTIDERVSRRKWIYVGALLLLGSASMDHVPAFGDVVPSMSNILICLYLFVISEAVIHQRLLNVGALINRVFVVMAISLGATVIYTLFVAWVDRAPALFALNTFIASFIVVVIVEPIKRLIGFGTLRVFNRKHLDLANKVEDAQLQLTGVLDSFGLAQLSLVFLDNALRYESATVFVLRSDGTKFRRIRGVRDEDLSNREILANHPIVEFFNRMRRRGETPVILDQYLLNEIDRTVSQAQKQSFDLVLKGLQGLNANIAIPFVDGTTVLGFVAVRASNPPEPWGNNWGVLSVLYPFFLQAARTLKNMGVYVRLREKDRLATLGEMAAGLAHEIRNPLGAIKGAAQYLQPQSEGPQSAFLQVIVEEVNRLNKVVTQFLDYSKPLAVDMVDYNMGVVLERTHDLFKSADAGTKIELVKPSEGFGALPKVKGSPEQIKQVMVNLVQNAVQSLGQKPPCDGGSVRMGAYVESGAMVAYVEDNGQGISKDNLEKIFIPFFTTNPLGTGLGLPICSRIVAAHGGRIDVQSEEGKFTRFSIHFPIETGHGPEQGARP